MKPNKHINIRSIEIRQAGQEEIPIIQHLAGTVYGFAYLSILGKPQVEYMLEKFYSTAALVEQMRQGHHFLISKNQEEDVAFVSYNCLDSRQGIFKLQKLYVLPEMQGEGLGAYLVNAVTIRVWQNGGKVLRLNINRYNQARGFYEKLSFRVIETVDIPIGEGYFMNDYVMEKDLEG